MFRFEELIIWKDAIRFTNDIYKIGKTFPKSELFALQSQI